MRTLLPLPLLLGCLLTTAATPAPPEPDEREGPRERADRHGYPHLVAETVARGQQDAERVVEVWMASQSHRDIILNCDRVAVGVGEADRAWTQKLGHG